MKRPSEWLARLEDTLVRAVRSWLARHRARLPLYAAAVLCAWYFYGMLINSIALGIASTFSENPPPEIWVLHPVRNWLAVFTPTGLGVTAVGALLVCLITKKGYNRFSGYRAISDARGFDILPDGTHGTAQFMTGKHARTILQMGRLAALTGNVYGRLSPEGDDHCAAYLASNPHNGLNGNILLIGAPGTGKSRGFVRPFILQCVKRRESIVLTDPKAELFESMGGYLEAQGYALRVLNLLDMAFSDAWNCIGDADHDPHLMQTIAATIIQNTSNEREAGDFWAKGELNLLLALLYYVQGQTGADGQPLPLCQRSLGQIYRLLATTSMESLDSRLRQLPGGHPARAPYGLFLQAKENIRGNIAIGLGNRLNVFQSAAVDRITRHNSIDLTLPGQRPCAYFCILSAQDSTYAFLSSLFFSMLFSRLADFARRQGENGRLPVAVHFCLDEFCNIGKLSDFKRTLSVVRGYGMHCQLIVQSIAQLADLYPRDEWQELAGNCDCTIYLGGNDMMTADFVSRKCGMSTIRVTNNQMPLLPLFSPVYTSTRPYSQTRSNTQRALMLPDEVLRLDNAQCLVMLRGQNPLRLYKVTPEEFAGFAHIRPLRIADYQAHWQEDDAPPEEAEDAAMPAETPTIVLHDVRAEEARETARLLDDLLAAAGRAQDNENEVFIK